MQDFCHSLTRDQLNLHPTGKDNLPATAAVCIDPNLDKRGD